MERTLDNMHLGKVMDETEWSIFKSEFEKTARHYKDIIGAIAVGSLIQPPKTPTDFYKQRRPGLLGTAYEDIRNPERRKPQPCDNSDLDIWLCLADNKASYHAGERVDTAGMALLEEIAAGTLKRGTLHWSKKKYAVFNDFYKNPIYYSDNFREKNSQTKPWLAEGFKKELEYNLIDALPKLAKKINQNFTKSIPGDFLEIRAYPESLFHLRPDDTITSDGFYDRQPFPRIADDQWISTEHSSYVLYNTPNTTIYPFVENGRILGMDIEDHIYMQDNLDNSKSYGCILLKPDAIKRGQADIIKQKIVDGISKANGTIAAECPIEQLTDKDIERMYPLLRGEDLIDAKEYLSEGEVIAYLVEAPISQLDMFSLLSEIKGPRLSDRTNARLAEGRTEYGAIRDLIPLPGDEKLYNDLIPTILEKQHDPSARFTENQYKYYSRNLAHTPDNSVELHGLLKATGLKAPF